MKFLRQTLKVLAYPGVVIAGHSLYVYSVQQRRIESVLEQRKNPLGNEFRVGTTDDMVMDKLKSGDILLFQRKWYQNYLPYGLIILLYRKLFNCDYDHIGIIVVDQNYGKPYVLENTLSGGMKCRPFSDRIQFSASSELISLIPLEPRDFKFPLTELLKDRKTVYVGNNEFREMFRSCKDKIVDEFLNEFGKKSTEVITKNNQFRCPNVDFLSQVFKKLGISLELPEADTRNITIQGVNDRSIILRNEVSSKVRIRLSEETVNIRTR
jgi:hypothetical protein